MQKIKNKYEYFNEAPRDEQEIILSELYFKIRRKEALRIMYLRFRYTILALPICLIMLVTFKIDISSTSTKSLLLLSLGIFLLVFKSISSIKYEHINIDSTLTIEKFRERLNKVSLMVHESDIYTSYPYRVIRGIKPNHYPRRYIFYSYYVRTLYSNDEIIELLDNYTKSRKLKPYRSAKNSLSRISSTRYNDIQRLIRDGKTQELHDILEDMCK